MGSFAYFSSVGAQTIAPGEAVEFNQIPLPAILPVDIGFISPSEIIINSAGVYEITYYALPENSNITFAIYIDGIEAPLSRYTTITSAGHISAQTLINIIATPAVITLVNVNPQQDAHLNVGSLPNTISASLLIAKLS